LRKGISLGSGAGVGDIGRFKEARVGDIVMVYNSGEILGIGKIISNCIRDSKLEIWSRGGYLRKVRWIQPFISSSVKENKILYSRHGFKRPATFFKLPQDCVIELVRFLKKRGVNLLALTRRVGRERALEPSTQKPILRKYRGRKVSIYNKKIERYSRDNIKLEKSSKNHQKILNRLASILKQQGLKLEDSKYIDLTFKTRGARYVFEVKSCRSDNVVSQIRRGVAQIYEYRFLMLDEERNIKLFLVLGIEPPKQPIDFLKYLEEDRNIGVIFIKNRKLVCSSRTAKMLSHVTMEE
jgi:hypothetical protein